MTWNKGLSGTSGGVTGTDFWQDEALGICWCPECGVAAMDVTQGHGGSPDSLFPNFLTLGFVTGKCHCCVAVSD